jgi:hypothetical protein
MQRHLDCPISSAHIQHFDRLLEGAYFYRVTSEHIATVYHPRDSGDSMLFEARCEFVDGYVSRDCVEEHLRVLDGRASAFVSVFSDFGRIDPC